MTSVSCMNLQSRINLFVDIHYLLSASQFSVTVIFLVYILFIAKPIDRLFFYVMGARQIYYRGLKKIGC